MQLTISYTVKVGMAFARKQVLCLEEIEQAENTEKFTDRDEKFTARYFLVTITGRFFAVNALLNAAMSSDLIFAKAAN